MNKLKKQFSDLRKSTPKHIQWLLLAAAFVVVLILLTLLLTNRDKEKLENPDEVPITLNISPDTIDWANTMVGDVKTQTITVTASAPVKIIDIRTDGDATGLNPLQQTCSNMYKIDQDNLCTIELTYNPTSEIDAHAAEIHIDWRGEKAPDIMTETSKVVLVLGAQAPEIPEPEPVVIPEPEPLPEPEPVIVPEPEPLPEPEPTYQQEIQNDLDVIMPSDSFMFDEPLYEPTIMDEPEYVRPPEACDDFAMPAYNLSGVQNGWIRPSGGAYYFHPFSDTTCSNPTGVYNPDNGIITDINNPAQKIGTDAEHIGYTTIMNGALPQLSNPISTSSGSGRAVQLTDAELGIIDENGALVISELPDTKKKQLGLNLKDAPAPDVIVGTSSAAAIYSSDPFDRKFVLRQYKPIPATIVSEVRADPSLYGCDSSGNCSGQTLPVRATVDRNVYADDGRTIVIPTGTLMLGYVTGELPGPYKTVGRMQIKWYQFILPSGVEFNFKDAATAPFSGDSQGRAGVPGHGSTDYVEQLVMPMITAIVPAAVNMIAPIADTFVNQIDLDNNTVVQSGTVRSSELAKQEIITAWNQVAQKLLVDAMDNTIPPFSIAAGTRITVYSPNDLVITCGSGNDKECSVENVMVASGRADRNTRNDDWQKQETPRVDYGDDSWIGQARSFDLTQFCINENGTWEIMKDVAGKIQEMGYEYRTVLAYCQSLNYEAINNARQDALYQDQQKQFQTNYGTINSNAGGITGISGGQTYNEEVLGMTYDESGAIQNPFASTSTTETAPTENVITCEGGALPDEYGCCPGEIYTDMGEQGFNCCPEDGIDCFPPIL